ncbi:MAG: PPOX class F420-dependent oxidoreductase [Acidimicrobiales bacterium]
MVFSKAELAYMSSERLGRLGTLTPGGTLQNSPVGFSVNPETGTIDIGGWNMASSAKFHNVAATGEVAFVVDDIASVDPWVVRCLEVRGRAEALRAQPSAAQPGQNDDIIRVHPRRIISWGLGPDGNQGSKRNVDPV